PHAGLHRPPPSRRTQHPRDQEMPEALHRSPPLPPPPSLTAKPRKQRNLTNIEARPCFCCGIAVRTPLLSARQFERSRLVEPYRRTHPLSPMASRPTYRGALLFYVHFASHEDDRG